MQDYKELFEKVRKEKGFIDRLGNKIYNKNEKNRQMLGQVRSVPAI